MELAIKPFAGIGKISFGMSAEQVEFVMGKAQRKSTGGKDIIEVRDKITYIYKEADVDSRLTCCIAGLSAPFFYDGERIPFTQLEAIIFFKKRSQMNMRFPMQNAYVFCDCGVVLYLHTEVDIRAGVKVSEHTMRIAICDNGTLLKYIKYFLSHEKINDSELSWFLTLFGAKVEEFTNLDEEELKALSDKSIEVPGWRSEV